MATVVALDFESTGLLKSDGDVWAQPGIVEIGAVKFNNSLGINDVFEFGFERLLDPECHYEEEAQRISGISAEKTYGKPTFKEVFPDFANFMLGVEQLVTYNGTTFDRPLLQFNLIKAGCEYNFPWPPKHIDLMTLATPILNMQGKSGTKPPKLIELYMHLFGAEFEGQHRALDDAKATMNCALKLRDQGHLWQ